METQQAYQELGLDPSASDSQLKASWRRLVATWHPDRNTAADAGLRMQRINKAYQHIRAERDGRSADEGPAHAAPPGRSPQVRKVRLTLEEAILGCTRTVRGHIRQHCATCAGKGKMVLARACGNCHGSGAVHKPALFGWLWNQEPCADCGGDGRQRAHCQDCDGQGEQSLTYRRRVRFPAGLRAGDVLGVPGTHAGSMAIDLELQLEIEPHPFFVLDEDGVLRCTLPVNGYAWLAGRWVEVPTPEGLQHMRLNRDALVYRLAGRGFPQQRNGARGDLRITVRPQFAEQEDPATAALLDQLVEHTSARMAKEGQPLGQWQQQLRHWQASRQDRAAGA